MTQMLPQLKKNKKEEYRLIKLITTHTLIWMVFFQ